MRRDPLEVSTQQGQDDVLSNFEIRAAELLIKRHGYAPKDNLHLASSNYTDEALKAQQDEYLAMLKEMTNP